MASDNPFVEVDESEHDSENNEANAVNEQESADYDDNHNDNNDSNDNNNSNPLDAIESDSSSDDIGDIGGNNGGNNGNNNNSNNNNSNNNRNNDDNDTTTATTLDLATLVRIARARARARSQNNNNNNNNSNNSSDSSDDNDENQRRRVAQIMRALYGNHGNNSERENENTPKLEFVSDNENDSKQNDSNNNNNNNKNSNSSFNPKNIFKSRFKLTKRKLFPIRKTPKNDSNNNNKQNDNNDTKENVDKKENDRTEYEKYVNYSLKYELSELDKRRAELRLNIESRNDCVIKSVLPILDKNIKQQFKNYKNYKKTILKSFKEYQESIINNNNNSNDKNDEMVTTTGSAIASNDNNENNIEMSMDDTTMAQNKDDNDDNFDLTESNDVNLFPPKLNTYEDSKEESMSRQESPHLPAEKEIIQSNRNSHAVLPFNFNHYLQFRETQHSHLGYNASMRYKQNDNVFASSSLECFNAHSRIFCCDFSADGNVLCCASQDHVISLIDSSESHNDRWKVYKQVQATFDGWSIIDVALAPDHSLAAYSGWSENVCVVNTHGQNELHEQYDMDPQVRGSWGRCCAFGIEFDPDSTKIAAGWSNGVFTLYDLETKRILVRSGSVHDDDINTITFCDRNLIATGSDDALIKIFDTRAGGSSSNTESGSKLSSLSNYMHRGGGGNGMLVGGFIGHLQGLTSLSVPNTQSNSNYLLSNGKDQCLKLWDLRSMNTISQLNDTKSGLKSHTQTFDYRYGGYNSKSRKTKKLKLDNSLMTYMGHRVVSTLIRCGFSPTFTTGNKYVYCGSAAVGGSPYCDVFVYDILTGNVVKRLRKHRGAVRDVSWHPYAPYIVSASWDGTATRWGYRGKERDGEIKVSKKSDIESYIDSSNITNFNNDKFSQFDEKIDNNNNLTNKIDNYINKGIEWSDDELLLSSGSDDIFGNNNNNNARYTSSDDSGDDDDDNDDNDDNRYSRGARINRRYGLHNHDNDDDDDVHHSHGKRMNNKTNGGDTFKLTEKNSNSDYYKPKETNMEMAGSRRYRYY